MDWGTFSAKLVFFRNLVPVTVAYKSQLDLKVQFKEFLYHSLTHSQTSFINELMLNGNQTNISSTFISIVKDLGLI